MKLVIEINMDNAAFGDTDRNRLAEVDYIINAGLLRTMNGLDGIGPSTSWTLRDSNGNPVGTARVTEE